MALSCCLLPLPWGTEGSGDMRLNPDSGRRGGWGPGKREDVGREGGGGPRGRAARYPASTGRACVTALVHQLVAVLDCDSSCALSQDTCEPGQLLHHGHQVLEDKGARARRGGALRNTTGDLSCTA